jgi:C4-dicarboxylate-binding protein DctP
MRVQPSKVLEAQMRALGAIPQVLAFSEVYQALQTGVIDGSENTPSNMYTQKHNEVQKYITLSEHGYIGYVVIVNKKFWDRLPADIRADLERAMADATKYANDISQRENDDALQAIKKSGSSIFITLNDDQLPGAGHCCRSMMRWAPRIGKDVINEFEQEAKASGTN